MRKLRLYLPLWVCLSILFSCDIKDDLPLPLVKSAFTAFEVEGQCDVNDEGYADAVIDNQKRTVEIYVNDLVDLSHLKVIRMEASNDARIGVETPDGIVPLSDYYVGGNPVMDFRNDVTFVLSTYQDYRWTVSVHKVICREIVLQNQVGGAVVDEVNRDVKVYVSRDQDLRSIRVDKFMLGGKHGTVSPDLTGTVADFSSTRTFEVKEYGCTEATRWNVTVYPTDVEQSVSVSVFPHSVNAYVSGHKKSGFTPVVEYRLQGMSEWLALPSGQIQSETLDYTATITGLTPGTSYECRVSAGGLSSECNFKTAEALQLPNASFDDWHITGDSRRPLYQPWAEDGTQFWDTGNRGATTVGVSNSTFVTEGGRTFANLQSKFIAIKFAAGNIFAGTYLKTDGTNGVLHFGRPFESFPTKLQFDYTFKSSIINRGGGKWDDNYGRYISRQVYDGLRGQSDSCQVYIALLGDMEEDEFEGERYPLVLRTRPTELKLFNPKSENIIAYAQVTMGDDVPEWTTETLTLDYRYKDRVPKSIVVVATSSKYGDYFIGGDETLLRLDNMKLLYE